MGGVLNSLVNFILDRMHPIGSYYISDDNKNPETIFGGKWQKITDRFLYASGNKAVGSVGGEESHILTEAEMPRHIHPLRETNNTGNVYTDAKSVNATETTKFTKYVRRLTSASSGWAESKPVETDANRLHAEATGGGMPHNNMPPYQVVNIWKRIA